MLMMRGLLKDRLEVGVGLSLNRQSIPKFRGSNYDKINILVLSQMSTGINTEISYLAHKFKVSYKYALFFQPQERIEIQNN